MTKSVIVGDLSGLQGFLFAVPQGEGEQAKRLRARSFFIQMLAESCALKFLAALNWPRERLTFCGAAKFVLSAPEAINRSVLQTAASEINEWLRDRLGAQLFFAWADASDEQGEAGLWYQATATLQPAKLRAWADVSQSADKWLPNRLILSKVELHSNNQPKVPPASIFSDEVVGKLLPNAKWIEITAGTKGADFQLLNFGCKLHDADPPDPSRSVAIYSLTGQERLFEYPVEKRYLARHIPITSYRVPLTFEEIAGRSLGDSLLGVLKMDVDSLGIVFENLQNSRKVAEAVPDLSKRLDKFFSETLDREKHADARWRLLYTVFSGGDDLLLVGPWDVVFDYAGHVRHSFSNEFAPEGLTISAGLDMIKPKFPIQRAAERAEELLSQAKKLGKDRLAALGQIWQWKEHDSIANASKRLTDWVKGKAAQRGWLEELLQFAEAASGSGRFRADVPGLSDADVAIRARATLLAPARFAYQVGRKYPPAFSRNPNMEERTRFRKWANALLADFDDRSLSTTRYLPAILRFAIAATRSKNL